MTAGQRNCFTAIEECLNRYSFDDVVFALREHVLIQRSECKPGSEARDTCGDVIADLDHIRTRMADLLVPHR